LSSLFLAIDHGDVDIVAFLIENDIITPNTKRLDETPLLRAVTRKNVALVQRLLDLGADKEAFGCAVG
jgi:ankyrin repeat protein